MRSVILGVGVGHDASATVLVEGEIRGHVLRERFSGVRHHYGLDAASIRLCLREAGVTAGDLTGVAVASTQLMPAVVDDEDCFRFEQPRSAAPAWTAPPDWRLIPESARWNQPEHRAARDFLQECAEFWSVPAEAHRKWWWFQHDAPAFGPAEWKREPSLKDLRQQLVRCWEAGSPASVMHAPIEATVDGHTVPGVFVHHHAAHAASSFHSSPFESALVVTHDGGVGAESGHVFLAMGGRLLPLAAHHLECGQFYEVAGNRLGFHYLGAAGKLMGLAGYGRGLLPAVIPAGNLFDWREWARGRGRASGGDRWGPGGLYACLFDALVEEAARAGLDTSSIGDPDRLPNPAAAEIAFAIQRLTEETMLRTIAEARSAAAQILGEAPDCLCLSGGVALNCPANTRVWDSRMFRDIHIEPHCEDGGISAGAAMYLHHSLNGASRMARTRPLSGSAMMGAKESATLDARCREEFADRLEMRPLDDWWRTAADDLAENRIVALCHGRSETGPRALGHRSILAHPGFAANWERVNALKGREAWRPFAPVILQHRLRDWFECGPDRSPFMLFSYRVRESLAGRIPAVVHRDGTSRVQTVEEGDGALHRLLGAFEARSGLPVLLNTSFNGPRRAIVETAAQALSFLLETGIDVLYLDGWRVTRRRWAGEGA